MGGALLVRYSCPDCGLVDVYVPCAVRGPDEDVAAWMRLVTSTLGEDHGRRSPACVPATLRDVKIPLPPEDGGRIGDPAPWRKPTP